MAKNINITDDMDLTKEIYDPVLLRKLVYKKYSEEDLIKELREFAETKLNPYAINSRGKSTNLLMIHFFREVQYKAKVESSKYTPDEILDHPDELKKVYEYLKTKPRVFSHEYPVDNLIHWYSNNRNTAGRVGNFSPVTARKIYESSMPKFNATIYDYSCGFGARMLGCLASQYNYKYLGTDPNSELFVSLNKFAPFVCDNLDRGRDYDIRCQGSEVFVPEWENTVDMSFSSPPYFTMELYSDDEGQSVNKYKEYDAWVKNYVQGTLNNIYRYTKKGGIHAVNLKNTDGKRMLEDWCLCALKAGFKLKRFEKINGEEGFLVKKMAHQSQRNFGKRDENGKLHRFNYEAGYEPIVYFVKE